MTYCTWDTETSIRESYKRKANPFDPENFVVMSGYKRKGGNPIAEYYGRAGQQGGPGLPRDWFTKLLEGTRVLVGANIKFDLLYALREPHNLAAWMPWVASGGLVWDIQLAEYLLEGMSQENHMLSLDEMAPRYGGNVKFDEVKAMWTAGISTEDINPDLLFRYLIGNKEDHGDIGNTELVFLGQLERARACGQLQSIYLNMGSLLCTTEMERNGMAVDKELGFQQAEVLAQDIATLSVELSQYLPADLPFEFNWGSTRQKSAIIFGGNVPYQKRMPVLDAEGNQAYAQMAQRHVVLNDGSTIPEGSLSADGRYGELVGTRFANGKKAGEYKTKQVNVNDPDKPKSRLEDVLYSFPRITAPKKQWAGAVAGTYSTAAEVIAELADRGIPFLEALGKITSLTKDLSTYYISTDEETGQSKGMLTLVQASGIIHHMLNHTSTVTGRFSSSNPNLQNLPKGNKSNVKALFKSRFKEGLVIQSDFSSLEVFVQAIITGCTQLIEDLRLGLDMHCQRVSQKEGITYEEALARCKDENHPDYKVWDTKRTKAKIFSFQRAFGAGAATISEKGKMPLADVEALIKAEYERYPETEDFFSGKGGLIEQLKQSAVFSGKVTQHPDIPGLVCHFKKSSWRAPDGKLYVWRESPSPEFLAKRGIATSFSPTEAKNYPVQGTGGEWAKAAMWLAIRAYYAEGNFGGLALLVNQVHDALYTDADPSVALRSAVVLHACMEEASTLMEWYFDWPLPIAVPSDTKWGANMMDEKAMPEGFRDLVAAERQRIRTTYIGGHQPSCEQPINLAA